MSYMLWVVGVGLHGQFYAVTDAYLHVDSSMLAETLSA